MNEYLYIIITITIVSGGLGYLFGSNYSAKKLKKLAKIIVNYIEVSCKEPNELETLQQAIEEYVYAKYGIDPENENQQP